VKKFGLLTIHLKKEKKRKCGEKSLEGFSKVCCIRRKRTYLLMVGKAASLVMVQTIPASLPVPQSLCSQAAESHFLWLSKSLIPEPISWSGGYFMSSPDSC